jgi:tetratricopeptide (TPR) repeat protein
VLIAFVMIRPARQSPNTDPSTIELYDVPLLSPDEARTAIAQNPNDPSNYLALARAEVPSGNLFSLMNTLKEGARHSDDPIRYWLTVGTGAIPSGHLAITYAAYNDALMRAASGDNYPQVRAFVGEQLYNAAQLPGAGELRVLQAWFGEQEADSVPPLLEVMYARTLSKNGRHAQLRPEVSQIIEEAPDDLAEAHLVRGEWYVSSGEREQAIQEWESARSQADAPQWVRERATELIEST